MVSEVETNDAENESVVNAGMIKRFLHDLIQTGFLF